jgi:thiol:disulfide interchange protein
VNRHLYPDAAEARQDISEALAKAGHEHKRVLVEFGGDWCGDCQVLDIYMHESPNAQLVAGHYVVVHVSIGQMDQNIDVAAQYGVPVAKGVPALAVLNPDGSVVYAQTNGEFDRMREMTPAAVTTFLKQWQG